MRRMLAKVTVTAALAAVPASAGTMSGNAALAFAALVGAHSPALPEMDKYILSKFLNGETRFQSWNAKFSFSVSDVHCRYSDVDITEHRCTISFGSRNVELDGREGGALLATMALAGVESDGAAGTIHYEAKGIACTVDPAEVKSKDGGGAMCSYNGG